MTTQRSDVTIVISSYNQAAFIGEAVQSALQQNVACTVLVVDDGSNDGSAEIAEQLGAHVVRRPHRGAMETFRTCVELVETPFYCLLNGDDGLEPTYVARTRPLIDDPRVGFVYTGVLYTGAVSGTRPARAFDAGALRWGNYVHGASLTRKAAYDAVGGFDRAFVDQFEDWALWVSIANAGWIGVPVDQPLLRYRRHVGASRNPTGAWELERARWRIATRYPRFYGAGGFARLAGSSLKLALTPNPPSRDR